MRHKHCDVIKAWADGAVIQFRHENSPGWKPCDNNTPTWHEDCEYRASLAIVEGKPVFEGDELYAVNRDNKAYKIFGASESCGETYLIFTDYGSNFSLDAWSWNPPKPKTVTVTIPMPIAIIRNELQISEDSGFYWAKLKFESRTQRDRAMDILRDAAK